MPELPEVESLRRYLIREGMPGSVFERVDVESKPSPEKVLKLKRDVAAGGGIPVGSRPINH